MKFTFLFVDPQENQEGINHEPEKQTHKEPEQFPDEQENTAPKILPPNVSQESEDENHKSNVEEQPHQHQQMQQEKENQNDALVDMRQDAPEDNILPGNVQKAVRRRERPSRFVFL